ncbi:hypothetical protein Poli38472_007676 [Pythium oligandrum]|uniref:Uncharacterized protein n=1 Tax=Pythium oligandrum TaxID=41045 RepID=A0A8K1CR01_PYTOL|nr:hypothetical protein Poli38472_007676 [Pythium oligandrum]|eukprot:TMW68004.1 hypothetical protein Poli38472_007676 [Pythium oligandrum]
MFEKIVESILVEYVSEWVEGLDAEKMKIALFSGKVEVRELKLKAAALDKFQLPLRVKQGTLGRLTLKVPWKRLTTQAVKLQIEDLFVLVVPSHQEELQKLKSRPDEAEDSYAMRMRFTKQQEVRVRELFEKSKQDDTRRSSDAEDVSGTSNSGDTTASWGYREKILHNIMDNVSVEIKNVHVRYEDTTQMLTKKAFALGLTIDSIHVNTTNANGHVTFVDRAQSHTPFVHKILEVVKAGLYIDDVSSAQEMTSTNRQHPPASTYVINPFNISAKMTVNHDETTSFSIPKLQVVADIGSIMASVTQSQCNDLISAINFISTHEIYLKRIHIRKQRPKIPVRRDPRSWWMYAFHGVQVLYSLTKKNEHATATSAPSRSSRKQCSWKLFGKLWMQRKEYIALHKKLLRAALKKTPLESVVSERNRLVELEDDLDVDTIVFFRLCAEQEFELEENRQDSIKKLNWKAKFKSNKSSDPSSAMLRRLASPEKLLLYSAIHEQMSASTTVIAAQNKEKLDSKAILFALDLAVSSFGFFLVERDGSAASASSKEFLRFELDKFLFTIFQKTNSCTISSSIQSIQMLDFSNPLVGESGSSIPQPLFYTLPSSAHESIHSLPRREAGSKALTKETSSAQEGKFFSLTIDSSETILKIVCELQPFRYIHNLSIAAKLQTYFVIQVEVAPELRENAEEALANSSVWLNKAIFSAPVPPTRSGKVEKRANASSRAALRVVEVNLTLPLVDVFVLSSDTSPILEAKLTDLQFRSGDLLEAFMFGIEGVEIVFIDGIAAHTGDRTHSQTATQAISNGQNIARTSSFYELQDRKHSTILRKTRLVFDGVKITESNRVPRWTVKSSAPPIYFTLSSAQYHQLRVASAAWATSNMPKSALHSSLVGKTQISIGHKSVPEFDPDEEMFSLSVHIPEILVVLEGGGGTAVQPTEDPMASTAGFETAGIDLVLDIRAANVEVKVSPGAHAIHADFRQLLFSKRKSHPHSRVGSHGKKMKLTTAEAIAELNKEDASTSASNTSDQVSDPDPAYCPSTQEPTKKLIEIGQKVTLVISCVEPFKAKIRVQQAAIYWDHDLLISLFRSYIWGSTSGPKSAPSSGASSRTSSGDAVHARQDETVKADPTDKSHSTLEAVPPSPFAIEIVVGKWFVFLRPHGAQSQCFSIKLYGKDLVCDVTTLNLTYTSTNVHAKNGFCLESSRSVKMNGAGEDTIGSDGICELLRTSHPMSVLVETAGYGALDHRTGASTYVSVKASHVELNYVHAHIHLLMDHMQNQIIGFFNWVSAQLRPRELKILNNRTKLDVDATDITMLLPRGVVGNAIEREKKPERLELDAKRLSIVSRPFPSDNRLEQLLIRVDGIQLASSLVESFRPHTDAVASVDEAVSKASEKAKQQAAKHKTIMSKTKILVYHSVYVDHVSMPLPPKPKKKARPDAEMTISRPKRPLEMEDVAKEMENCCAFVRVSLQRPADWSEERKKGISIDPGSSIVLSIDQQQLELFACVLDENFGRLELKRMVPPGSKHQEENTSLDVQVMIGDVSLVLLQSLEQPHCESPIEVTERAMARLQAEGVRVSVNEFSSLRQQISVVASRARLWKVDQYGDPSDKTKPTRSEETECGLFYLTSEGSGCNCIDVTIDQPPPEENDAGPPQKDVRVHVDTSALLPPFINLFSRLEPFLACEPRFAHFTPSKGGPVNVSVSTGSVHCMLAQHVLTDHDDITLNLILTGCFVVRYTKADESLKHIQLFGRKMILEVAHQWPPVSSSEPAAVHPSPSATPTYSPATKRRLTKAHSNQFRTQSLRNYRRVLCDDFAVDMDIMDTSQLDNALKISASLTHFHAVLCVLDMFMMSKISKLAEMLNTDLKRTESRLVQASPDKKQVVVNMMLEDASLTFVREIGEYFSPLARVYSFCTMCKVVVETQKDTTVTKSPSTVVDVALHFSEDGGAELRDDEGLSAWAFNAVLGSWEPIIEPWTFALATRLETDSNGALSSNINISGSDSHSFNVNISPSLLDTFCAIAKEVEPMFAGTTIPISTASVISCGFYLANDSGASITYWMSDGVEPAHSRGFTYASNSKSTPEALLPRHKVPLKLSTALFSSLPNDQTISFSWGEEEWHPLTDVRIHSAGKYVYSVLSKTSRTASSTRTASATNSVSSSSPPKVLLALFDISTVFGYRTLTVSSLIRVFNDTDVTIDCAVLCEDGKTVTDISVLDPQEVCGVPITMIRSISSIRLLIRPHKPDPHSGASDSAHSISPHSVVDREHRWSNELFINEKEENHENFAACSLALTDYDCRCQRMFDGSQPLHMSETCRANGSFFRAWSRVFTASNASSLKYAQLRVVPPFIFENKCGVPVFIVVFVFKKIRRAGAQDREYSHIVASEKIPARSSMQFTASSLNEATYCSISLTGFNWSKLFVLPAVFSDGTRQPGQGGDSRTGSMSSSPVSGPALPPPSSPSSRNGLNGDILCTVDDFKSRRASINVTMHAANGESAMRRVVIQSRFVIHNQTSLALCFEPSGKPKSRIPSTKAFFSLGSATKTAAVCCGNPQLEMIHSKLNVLHGATTTPTTRQSASGKNGPSKHDTHEDLDETECFYCSETAALSIQIEGNTQATSGVTQFRLDAAVGGTNSTIRLFDESKRQWQDIVVILEQIDVFTTKATFVERYILVNRTDFDLLCVPACDIVVGNTQPPPSGVLLKAYVSSSYHWGTRQAIPSDSSIRLKLSDASVTGAKWSGKFALHDVSETALKLSNKFTSQIHVIRVEVRVESSVRVFVMITSEDSALYPLYRVINSSVQETVFFKQSFEGGSGELSEMSSVAVDYNRGIAQQLQPGVNACFGWDEAYFLQSLDRVLQLTYTADGVSTKVFLDQPGEAQRVELPATKERGPRAVYVHWYLNGITKTIHIHDSELPRDKLTGKLNVSASRDGSNKLNRLGVVSTLKLQIAMPNMMLSVLNSTPEEVLLFTAERVDVKYASHLGEHDECEVKVGSFQLDNQLSNAVFPVVFTPAPVNNSLSFLDSPKKSSSSHGGTPTNTEKSFEDDEKPKEDDTGTFFHLSVFRLSYGSDVEYLKYLSAMLQPARLQIDDFFVISMAVLCSDFIHIVQRYYPSQNARIRGADDADISSSTESVSSRPLRSHSGAPAATPTRRETNAAERIPPPEHRMYIETLQLHPIKIQVTFQQNNLSNAPIFDDSQSNFLLPFVFMILKSNLVNIDSAAVNLNALHIYHSFTTRKFMVSAIQQHYAFQGILQMYALVGSADILGNPLGLVTNLGTGVKDFFYEPMAGMVKSPQEFVLGLSRGTASLVKNSVYGTFNAASKFTGTLSSGIAALSMDSDYIKTRNTRNRHEVATHIGTGLFYGTKQLGQGIFAGVSGVLTAPAMGAYNNGLTGFVEGVGKGLIGVAVKPTAGILDLAAKTTAGITATATVFDKKARDTRMRLPRMMRTGDKRLRVYSNDEAMISQLLRRLPQKLLRNEHYEMHVFLPLSRAIVATSHQFFHVDYSSIAGVAPSQPRITWKFPISSVWGAQKSAKGVSIFIGSATNVTLSSNAGATTVQAPTVTKSSMSTLLVPLRETEVTLADRLIKSVSELVAKQRERAPVTETFSSPLPRNSIGMVLEPVRDANKVAGYEGYGGRVVDVFVGSACFRAGVEVGDIIVGFGKNKFEAGDHGSALRTQLSTMKRGDTLELMVLRHGEIKTIKVATE